MSNNMPKGYQIRAGSTLERALLVKFMNRTYKEIYPGKDFSHLAKTVEQYLSSQTPIWWVDVLEKVSISPVGCLWVGSGIDQVEGDRLGHIFLLYVAPEHRRRGIGSALVKIAENWARERGDKQISLQVFTTNKPAVNLYEKLGYENQSLLMVKSL
ncbi:MAG: GNAT family N-acetyltransferase [Cyanobacteriota bacterium]|nr:GNAT family N-acetyltransferase [Cyanobacteriota bacterium]